MSWQRALYDDLNVMRTYCEMLQMPFPEVYFTMNFLMMSLNVTLEDIQTFSGKLGEEEALRTFPRIRLWTEDAQSGMGCLPCRPSLTYCAVLWEDSAARLLRGFSVPVSFNALRLWRGD